MSRAAYALPHITLPEASLRPDARGWEVVVDGKVLRLLRDNDPFPEWDAQLVFRLEREFTVTDDIGTALGIDPDSDSCELLGVVATGGGVLRTVSGRAPLPLVRGGTVRMVLTPTSAELAKDLTIHTIACLRERSTSPTGASPASQADRLWELRERISLEGGSSRLAMYEVDLSKMFPGQGLDNAAFHVLVGDDPTERFEASVLVYLNTRRSAYLRALAAGHPEQESQLWESVIRRIVMAASLGEWIDDQVEYPAGSVGATVLRWTEQAFGAVGPTQVAQLLRDDFSAAEGRLEGWCFELRSGMAHPEVE